MKPAVSPVPANVPLASPSIDAISPIEITPAQGATLAEFAELYLWQQSIAAKLGKLEKMKGEIKSWYDDQPAALDFTASARGYEVQVSARSIEKQWTSVRKVYKAVGSLKDFLGICTVTFKAVAEKIGAEKAEALQVESRTGSRRIKAFAQVSEAPAKAA
ncbi:MAG: hypothetical protein M3N54_12550 [Acidobacteriota bacterium]|nr:hypothetical protein [Acidobacteriota bacterium]